jgi:hypothetical protein
MAEILTPVMDMIWSTIQQHLQLLGPRENCLVLLNGVLADCPLLHSHISSRSTNYMLLVTSNEGTATAEGLTLSTDPVEPFHPICNIPGRDDGHESNIPSLLARLRELVAPLERRRNDIVVEISHSRYDISKIRWLIWLYDIFFAEFARTLGWPPRIV